MNLLQPDSAAALAAVLAQASHDRQTIETGGAFSKIRAGGPRGSAQITLSTSKLNRVLNYEPRDLTISVEAGMPFAELSALLAKNQQMIPLDPPFGHAATIGGVIATNSSGPRRRWFGTARDLVIGMQYATMEGKLVQSGGMVVKNVAGLDTGKLHIGALGTLGVITVLNFKLLPMPVGTRTFAKEFATAAEAIAERDRILQSTLQPMALDLLNPAAGGRKGFTLLLEAGGQPNVLDRYARELPGFQASDNAVWEHVNSYTESFLATHPNGCVVRISSKFTEAAQVFSAFTEPVIMRAGNGVAYAYCAAPPANLKLKHVIEYAPEPRPANANLWPSPSADFDLMRRVKDMMDPHHLLNPGRLYGKL